MITLVRNAFVNKNLESHNVAERRDMFLSNPLHKNEPVFTRYEDYIEFFGKTKI